ncbi:MAG: tetratricopeptide repeat protein [Spirochaetaceae bacterium]|jgi:tetratricopeptide (TPR) repeat protein|nr:tetratricopeptide repeat protein [Spirochaetaceae bacterium]
MMVTATRTETLQEGIRLFKLKRWDMALRIFQQLESNTEEDSYLSTEIAYYLGLCYTKLGRFDDALFWLEQVVKAESNIMRVYQCRLTLAYIYVITERAKMAEFELDRLSEIGFESVQLYTVLAYSACSEQQYQKAVELYAKALQLDNTNATAMNGLGYILVDKALNVEQGLVLCKKAVDLNPDNAAYLDSLGWAYFKHGDTGEAKAWLRRALGIASLESQQQEIRKHIRHVAGET